jgi:hypothetical protein
LAGARIGQTGTKVPICKSPVADLQHATDGAGRPCVCLGAPGGVVRRSYVPENELRNSCPVFGWTWIGSRFSVWDKPKQRLVQKTER